MQPPRPSQIRVLKTDDLPVIFEIINDSARAYQGVIPPDAWHEPYMSLDELESEIRKGVRFYVFEMAGRILGVMGIQEVKDVTLVRHAYVRTECRGRGIGRSLLDYMIQLTHRPVLIGTWKAATWAIEFYRKNGFELVSAEAKDRLLRTYWTIPERQAQESVVLAKGRWFEQVYPLQPGDGRSNS
jgi:N-acetylglutamate synthase-like GNAT family acetyltransferase